MITGLHISFHLPPHTIPPQHSSSLPPRWSSCSQVRIHPASRNHPLVFCSLYLAINQQLPTISIWLVRLSLASTRWILSPSFHETLGPCGRAYLILSPLSSDDLQWSRPFQCRSCTLLHLNASGWTQTLSKLQLNLSIFSWKDQHLFSRKLDAFFPGWRKSNLQLKHQGFSCPLQKVL